MLGDLVELLAECTDTQRCHHLDLGTTIAGLLRRCRIGDTSEGTKTQGQHVTTGECVGEGCSICQRGAKVGTIDSSDQQSKLSKQVIKLGEQLLWILWRLLAFLDLCTFLCAVA